MVNTPNGLIDIANIKTGDEVLSRHGNSQKVMATFSRQHDGYLYRVSSSVIPVEATEGHPVLVMRCRACVKQYESYKACVPNCVRKNGNCARFEPPEETWVNIEDINPETDFHYHTKIDCDK